MVKMKNSIISDLISNRCILVLTFRKKEIFI